MTGAQAELAAIAGGAAVHHRLVNGSWSAPVAIGGVNLKHIAIASSP